MTVLRTDGSNPLFLALIPLLDAELWERYPETMHLFTAGNIVDAAVRVVVLVENGEPVGCGCLRPFADSSSIELKRMFVKREWRGSGFSKIIVRELVAWAGELGFTSVLLETGVKQPEAIGLYESMGFARTENYSDYTDIEESICMKKELAR